MATDRRLVRLDQLYEFASGLSKPRSAFGEGFPFLSFGDVFHNTFVPRNLSELVKSSEAERRKLSIKRGDVFLTRTSETVDELGMSCVALTDVPNATFNGFTKRLRPRSQGIVVPEYAGYFFRSPSFRSDVYAMSSLSTRASLNNEMLARLAIMLPSLGEQAAIGRILKSLDDKIGLNRQTNETLGAMARALFKSWFVDFDPVRAKAEGREAGLSKEISNLFPTHFVNSELGEIPEGWALRPLCEVLTPRNQRAGEIDAPEYSSTNAGLQPRSERFKKQLSASRSNNKLIREGDLVFGLSREVMNFGLMRDPIGSVSSAYKVFNIRENTIVPDLLERMMRMRPNYFFKAVSASSREGQSISFEALGVLKFVQPAAAVQSTYYAMTEPLRGRAEYVRRESQTLVALRDALLPKLISGELRVKTAEKMVGAVA